MELFDYKKTKAVDYDISFGSDLGAADEVVSLVSLIFSASSFEIQYRKKVRPIFFEKILARPCWLDRIVARRSKNFETQS